jgi:hypothetical protein
VNEAELRAFRQALESSPSLFPLQLSADGKVAQFVHLAAADFQAASFLDGRIMGQGRQSALVAMEDLRAAAGPMAPNCDFIFHISHCGSTLISRLLGAHPSLLSVREPAILRAFPQWSGTADQSLFLGLWSRTFEPGQRAILKATSFVAEIAASLLTLVPSARALCVYVPLATFLPSLLGGAMSDIEHQAVARYRRLQRQGLLDEQDFDRLSPGEKVAMSWLAEMLSLADAQQRFPQRTRWIDFDALLAAPAQSFDQLGCWLGLGRDLLQILDSPIMQRYAKKTEVAYDATFRRELLRQSQDQHAEEISRGLIWVARTILPEHSCLLPLNCWK